MNILEALRNIFIAPLELIFEAIFTVAFNITQSEGLAIIILSIVVSTLVLPLYKRAEKLEREEHEKEKKLEYWSEHIKRNFTGDERYMRLNTYYRENHYNPIFQLKSTISILLQIPFFIAAYDLLGVRAARSFAGKSFLFFADLGLPDACLSVGQITINLMPILMTLISLITTYIYTKGLPAKVAIRSLALPLLFLIVLYNSPSSLLLYWTMNNVYSLIKTIILKTKTNKKRPNNSLKPASANKVIVFWDQEPKFSAFILPMVFLSVLTGLLIPLAYLSASPEEFIDVTNPQNPLHYLLSSFCIASGFFIIWPSVFYYLSNTRTKNLISAIMFGVSVFSVVNYLFFGNETGTINTILVFDQTPSYSYTQKITNVLLVLIIMIACIFLYRFKNAIKIAFIAFILTAITISVIDAKKVIDTYNPIIEHIEDYREEEAPQIVLSSTGKNVVVIMLDRAVSGYIPYVFNEFPELNEQFDGFVYYPNAMSFGQKTMTASSALFGGYEYTPEQMDARTDETLAEKHDEALKVMPKLFSEQGYGITLMDLPLVGWGWNGDYSSFEDIDNLSTYHATDYYSDDTETDINTEYRRNRNMFAYSIFRCAPICLQELIYDDGDYLSVADNMVNNYNVLQQYKVLENLDDMTIVNDEYKGYLLLIDNETTHDTTTLKDYNPYIPLVYDTGFYISDGNNELYMENSYQAATYECFVAAIREIGNYMDYLKEIGVYDNTRIIIVSDHATQIFLFEDLYSDTFSREWYNCLLMVKDFDSTGFSTDYTFMTNADVPTIAMEGIINDPINPYTGNLIDSAQKNGDIYVSYYEDLESIPWNPDKFQGNTFDYSGAIWFKVINKNIFDEANWIETDYPLYSD